MAQLRGENIADSESRAAERVSAHLWLARFVTSASPFSIRSVGIALSCFAIALLVQLAFRAAGGTLFFATYFPAVLVAGLLGGPLPGVFVVFAGLLTVWWAFIPPNYSFFPLDLQQTLNIAMYLISAGCILFVTQRYRQSVQTVLEQERDRSLVLKELEHRSRNTFAVIDVIVRKTLQDEPERASVLSGRIRAVKFANELIDHSKTHTVLLRTLLTQEFMPYGEACFRLEGEDLELSADVARRLALIFHELVTNAAKYGALSRRSGRVKIIWKNEDGLVRLEWIEEGGPTAQPPNKQGFGSKVVTESLKSLSGSFAPTFAPEGLRCLITFRV